MSKIKEIFGEFKEFAIKGNVVDMAVALMIGAAFTSVVKSVVEDVVMPPIGYMTGGLNFTNRYYLLEAGDPGPPYASLTAAREAGANVLAYGRFGTQVITFLIVAFVLFLAVRWMNRLRRPDTPPAPTTRACPRCFSIIDKQATRCPLCTSEIEPPVEEPGEESEAAAASS
jgi:large conductance mechanosensitive channel